MRIIEDDKRSKKVVLVPFCVLCQAFQAKGIVKYNWTSSIEPIVSLLMKNNINIIQMPCPESSFNGYENSLGRKPAGLKFYDVENYQRHCRVIANDMLRMMKAMKEQEYEIVCILGIEMSPSCAASYIYSNKGMQKRKGVFLDILYRLCVEEGIEVPLVGVNRKSIKKAMESLEKLVGEQ